MPDKIDAFESIFKSADKLSMVYDHIDVRSVLLVTDRNAAVSDQIRESAQRFLSVIEREKPSWETIGDESYQTVDDLIGLVKKHGPDLIVTYRHLHETHRRPRMSLGVFLDELTQATTIPVLVLPTDEDGHLLDLPPSTTSVMVVTDHLTGDNELVDYGARFTVAKGTLVLVHIEDDATFETYLAEFEKIPDLETDLVRNLLRERLLKAPSEYVQSCIEVLRKAGLTIRVESKVAFGHRINDYEQLLNEHSVELLIFHTREDTELAMGGMAYLMTARFTKTPLLLL
ncbi:MAG: hypothetical protein MI923_29800 [Phycisphaerales bacterium]|nr:hypothetical protein [Phycisphaerales bacterium]